MKLCRSTWHVFPVLLLAGCGRSPGTHNDAALPDTGVSADVVTAADAPADLGTPVDVVAVSDALGADAPVDVETTAFDTGPTLEAGSDRPSERTCIRAEMYPAPPCPGAGWFQFTDTRCYLCGPSDPGCPSVGHQCAAWGDKLCYRQCATAADCPDPCMPFCRKIILFAGADQCGASTQSVCLRQDMDSCGSLPSQ